MKIQFMYHGNPRGQERPRFGGRAYKTAEAKAYENAIAIAYKIAVRNRKPLEGPLGLYILAGYPIPASASRAQRAAMVSGEQLPTKKPDIDNVVKAILDALNGQAWVDDKQVVCVTAKKFYTEHPGLIVTICTGEDLQAMKGASI